MDYLEACVQKLRHFHTFVLSVDSLLAMEAEATLKCIANLLISK